MKSWKILGNKVLKNIKKNIEKVLTKYWEKNIN